MAASLQFIISADASGAITAVRQFSGSLANVGSIANTSSNQAISAFDRIDKIIGKAKSAVIGFVSAFVFIQAVRGLHELLAAAVRFEDQFSNVRKTVSATAEQFNLLSESLKNMSRTLPTSLTDLTKIAEIAGQLGINVDDIDDFTEVIADGLDVTFIQLVDGVAT